MWPDEDGGWSITTAPTGFESPGTSYPTDALGGSPTGGGASQSSNWDGWWQSLTSTGLNYLIARDAAENGLVRNGQTYQRSNTAAVPLNSPSGFMGLAIIGGLALLVAFAIKKG